MVSWMSCCVPAQAVVCCPEFTEFLDDETSPVNYRDAIKRMLRLDERRLVVNLDDLRDYKRELSDGWGLPCSAGSYVASGS